MSYQHFELGGLGILGREQARSLCDPESESPVHSADAPNLAGPPISAVHDQAAAPSVPAASQHHTAPANEDFFAQQPAFQVQLSPAQLQHFQERSPYGSGDSDDGYTLVFDTTEDFQAWRANEEEDNMVEFIKGDTHGSKAVPPRFKDHVKLVCARHCKSGRRKYVRKCPERNRKVPSRKIEGEGCPASISYKTYYGTTVVRAMYINQHSHPTGLENLPFTRRGRKLAEQERKRQQQDGFCRANPVLNGTASAAARVSPTSGGAGAVGARHHPQSEYPPMASLEPPSPVKGSHSDNNSSLQSQATFNQGSLQSPRANVAYQEYHAQASSAPTMECYNTSSNEYGNYRLMQPSTPQNSTQPSTTTPVRSFKVSSNTPDLVIPQTEQSCMSPPMQANNYQMQQKHTLLTPTTPSPRYQAFTMPSEASPFSASTHCLPSPSYSQPHFSPTYEHMTHTYPQTHITQSFEAPQQSPLSPHTPNNSVIPVAHDQFRLDPQPYLMQSENFDDYRWDRLELLFQEIRLYARSYTFPKTFVAALESVLLRLRMEVPNDYSQRGELTDQVEQGMPQRPAIRALSTRPSRTGEAQDMCGYVPLNTHMGVLGMSRDVYVTTNDADTVN
ncbi:hypothetical protein M0805_007161 [Coniferiporia weirii]|nr:hypothetical protein M0805_007161 [Coniferiporia weirii]